MTFSLFTDVIDSLLKNLQLNQIFNFKKSAGKWLETATFLWSWRMCIFFISWVSQESLTLITACSSYTPKCVINENMWWPSLTTPHLLLHLYGYPLTPSIKSLLIYSYTIKVIRQLVLSGLLLVLLSIPRLHMEMCRSGQYHLLWVSY